jgi:hypothetical protein
VEKPRSFASRLGDEQAKRHCAANEQPEQRGRRSRAIERMVCRRARATFGHRSSYRRSGRSTALSTVASATDAEHSLK